MNLNMILPADNIFPLLATTIYGFSTILVSTFWVSLMLYIYEGDCPITSKWE